jgi:hypothetical protein
MLKKNSIPFKNYDLMFNRKDVKDNEDVDEDECDKISDYSPKNKSTSKVYSLRKLPARGLK